MKEPRGLGGWLVVVQILLILAVIYKVYVFIVLNIDLDLNGFLPPLEMGFFVVALIFMYAKHRLFPILAIFGIWLFPALQFLVTFGFFLGGLQYGFDLGDFLVVSLTGFYLTFAIIGTIYFRKSRRVKNTFVN